MTRHNLIREVVARANDVGNVKYSQKDVIAILSAYENCVVENLTNGDEDKIPFQTVGYFTTRISPARTGTVMFGERTGEKWKSEAKKQIIFKSNPSVKNISIAEE